MMIVVLGESVIAAMTRADDLQLDVLFLSLLSAMTLKVMYFELQGEQCQHALRVGYIRALLWLYVHAPLYTGTIGIGAVLAQVSEGICWTYLQQQLYCILWSSVLHFMCVLQLSHKGAGKGVRVLDERVRLGFRFVVAVVRAAMAFILPESTDDKHVILICWALAAVATVFEFIGEKPRADSEDAETR
uniref:Uncharacterized protein n=1 Tax=Phaeomonas parva TaxID=124430 RepID=A0A6U4FAU4_9STRA|mmetsp:Transcript_23907/g.75309  ORF Transcript_23907/g.75309 Transcript_23907/m.75309 type:complete len:188 (+) Transcript_23907:395-958(+)